MLLKNLFVLGKLANKTIILNPGTLYQNVSRLLPSIDILTPNETEASILSGITILNIDDAQKQEYHSSIRALRRSLSLFGAQGSLLCERHRTLFISPGDAVVKDAAGAGDAFNGALAAPLARKSDLVSAIQYASAFCFTGS